MTNNTPDYNDNLVFLPNEKSKLEKQIDTANKIIVSYDRLVRKTMGTVFMNVIEYYQTYGIDQAKIEEELDGDDDCA